MKLGNKKIIKITFTLLIIVAFIIIMFLDWSDIHAMSYPPYDDRMEEFYASDRFRTIDEDGLELNPFPNCHVEIVILHDDECDLADIDKMYKKISRVKF